MAEEKIIISIDEDGALEVKTSGIFGESCFDEVAKILDEDTSYLKIKKTDDFSKNVSLQTQNKQSIGGK